MRRNRLWKQVMAIALTATMVFSLSSQVVFAENVFTEGISNESTETIEADMTEIAGTEEMETETEIAEIEMGETEEVEPIEEIQSATAVGDFLYEANRSGEVTITGYKGNDVEVVIPEIIDGKNVTRIGSRAFASCGSLTGVKMPTSITNIGLGAFQSCKNLTKIEIPASVTTIESYAFSGCSSLTRIEIPAGVKSIEDYCFAICSNLENIKIPDSITSIGEGAFEWCSKLESIKIPMGATSIGKMAFWECSRLECVEGLTSITSIGDEAFYSCSRLENIEIPMGVTSIGASAFENCSRLKSIVIPRSVISIGVKAFKGCSEGLTSIVVEEGNPSYNSGAGGNCIIETATNTLIVGCQNTVIAENVTSIGESAFKGCSRLTNIELPENVASIGESAFEGCSKLTNIELSENVTSIGESAFSFCSSLESIKIPNGVTNIEATTFSYCSKLTSVEIPNGVTSIGISAFASCWNLKNIRIPANVINIKSDTFSNCYSITIYCAENSYARQYAIENNIPYKSLEEWGVSVYNIEFDGNGAESGFMEEQSMIYGSGSTLNANAFQKKGYTFTGWNTKADGSGIALEDKADGSALTETDGVVVVLYAQWAKTKYAITFHGNGSTAGSMKKLANLMYGKTYTLPKNRFKKKGYTFTGWNTKKDGSGTTYENKTKIENLSAQFGGKVILYAQWSKTKYIITYNLKKGKNNKNNPVFYMITTKNIKLKKPTRKGYTFKGWYSDKKYTKKVTQIKKGSTGNITLYAKWVKKK